MKKFWNFIRDDAGERVLRLEGPIDEDSFWGTEITPQMFREELEAEEGDVTVWINSPGGNVFCAAEIYTMLCDHKGRITVKIDAIAASAASVVAMAGDRVLMSPVSMIMVHDPMTIAMGNAKDMEKAISTLNEVKASIINAYQKKTGLSRNKIAQLMSDETWMNAKKAVELGFADEILFSAKDQPEGSEAEGDKNDGKENEKVRNVLGEWQPYSTRIMGQTILNRLVCTAESTTASDEESDGPADGTADVEPAEAGVRQCDPIEEAVSDQAEASIADRKKAASEKNGDAADPDDDPDEENDSDEAEPETESDDPDTEGEDRPEKERDSDVADTKPKVPVIGMDGKTRDGAMPYELLKKQLDYLK